MELSQRLRVKPLREGQTKMFRLIGNGEVDLVVKNTDGVPQPRYNAGATFTGYFTIFDRFEPIAAKRKKILKNVTGTTTVIKEGKEVLEEVVSDIVFNRQGICVVKDDELSKLICLTRANENLSNPYRDKSKPALWEEMSPAETKKDVLEKMDLDYRAETYVMTADIKDLMVLAKKLSALGLDAISSDKKSDELRHDLRIFSRKNPKELLRNSKDKEMKLKIIIDDAMKLHVLDFDEDTKEWIWEEDMKTIVKVPAGEQPVNVLVDHLAKTKEDNHRLISEVNLLMQSEVEA